MYTLGFPNLGWMEMVVLLVLGLLIFGRRLPEVGKSLGKGIVEFRKGLKGIEDEVQSAETRRPTTTLPERESVARPPLTASGEDVRVSRAEPVEAPIVDRGAGPASI